MGCKLCPLMGSSQTLTNYQDVVEAITAFDNAVVSKFSDSNMQLKIKSTAAITSGQCNTNSADKLLEELDEAIRINKWLLSFYRSKGLSSEELISTLQEYKDEFTKDDPDREKVLKRKQESLQEPHHISKMIKREAEESEVTDTTYSTESNIPSVAIKMEKEDSESASAFSNFPVSNLRTAIPQKTLEESEVATKAEQTSSENSSVPFVQLPSSSTSSVPSQSSSAVVNSQDQLQQQSANLLPPNNIRHTQAQRYVAMYRFPCNICGRKFARSQALANHACLADRTCTICLRVSNTKKDLAKHMLTHAKSFRCNDCKRQFNRIEQLNSHACICKLICSHCGKLFQSRKCLEAHMLSHSDDRPHTCPICERNFVLKEHLNAHFAHMHSLPAASS